MGLPSIDLPCSVSQPAHDFFLYVTTEIYHYLDALACPISIDRVDVSCRGHENEQVSSIRHRGVAINIRPLMFVKDLETAPQKGIRHKIGRIQSPDY
ncbi:hypothetical protein PROFUN_15554 [Planoprotostelium fungivorum]|uniref:Uncharacterized protein n=1 Tax=Planoprotostelium fungivorum TaxID=1890364 RepID=A0A2P6MVC4_9EUKA|nr:hypothetical protein PROFUN_15554 [Planoprotostelium fungivorum]